ELERAEKSHWQGQGLRRCHGRCEEVGDRHESLQIVKDVLRSELGPRVSFDIPDHNPLETVRVRGVNARFCASAGYRTLFIDPHCDKHIHDFEAVQTGAEGLILKPGGPRAGSKLWLLTHISDAMGYWIDATTPLGREISKSTTDGVRTIGGDPIKIPRMNAV